VGNDEDWRRKNGPHKRQREERRAHEELKVKMDGALLSNSKLTEVRKPIRVEVTPDGLRIQIVDASTGRCSCSAVLQVQPYMRDLPAGNRQGLEPGGPMVALSGPHRFGVYARGDRGYSNWNCLRIVPTLRGAS